MSMPRKADASHHLRRLAVSRVKDGYKVVAVARFLGVSERSVRRWVARERSSGDSALATRPRSGRPPKLNDRQAATVLSWLEHSPCDFGFVTRRWTAPRVAELIERQWGVRMNYRYVSDWLTRNGITPQIPARVAQERDDEEVRWWVSRVWPRIVKSASDTGADLVFTDESGLLMAPLVRATLAPRAHTPVLPVRAKHRQKVSVAAALFRSAVTGRARLTHETFVDQYVDDFLYAEFLRQRVLRRSRWPLFLLQDNAPLHLGQWTQDVTDDFYPRLEVFQLPAYAPELNPVEQLWTWTKDKQLVNFVPADLGQLAAATEHVVGLAEHDQSRLQAFFDAAKLPW
jgi:transposase